MGSDAESKVGINKSRGTQFFKLLMWHCVIGAIKSGKAYIALITTWHVRSCEKTCENFCVPSTTQ